MREVTLKKCNCPHYCPQRMSKFCNQLLNDWSLRSSRRQSQR
jgi:hypothetical protein